MPYYSDHFYLTETDETFGFREDTGDSFQSWQGLRGPYYTPFVSSAGVISWTNNGNLPNPTAVNIRGPSGRGLEISGIAATTAGLPDSPAAGEVWLVGNASPYEAYIWLGGPEWIDLGELSVGPAGVTPVFSIGTVTTLPAGSAATATITGTDEAPVLNLGIPKGADGTDYVLTNQDKADIAELAAADVEPIIADAYDSSATYEAGEHCVHNGALYVCNTAITTAEQWTAAHWTEITVGEALEGLETKIGNDALSTTAQTLAGAINELDSDVSGLSATLGSAILRAAVQTVSASGTTSDITLTGLTANHVVGSWGMYSDSDCTTPIAENAPTCSITITTKENAWDLIIANFSSTFYLRPTFILKQN